MELDDSILSSIKQMLGLTDDVTAFDNEIIAHINSTFMGLNQIGVGSDIGFSIHGYEETWRDFIDDQRYIDPVREFIYLKTRLIFDPPASSTVSDAYNQRIAETEWRLNVMAEHLAAQSEEEGVAP